MHDPNRAKDRGNPHLDRGDDDWLTEEQDAAIADQVRNRADDAEARRLGGDPAWSASNPGLTGDATPAGGGTAEPGSGVPNGGGANDDGHGEDDRGSGPS